MGKYEDIRAAALEIMSDQGVRALTLPLLFERARTGAGTFYHHFKDRDDLVNAVFRYCYDTAVSDLSDNDDPAAPARERLDLLCKNIFKSYLTHPRELNFLYVCAFGYVEPDVGQCRVIPSIMLLTGIFTQAQETGVIASHIDPAVAARIVRSMVAGVFWGYEHGMCDMDEDAALRFAHSAWLSIETM